MARFIFLILCCTLTFSGLDAASFKNGRITCAAQKVLTYWFGNLSGPEDFPEQKVEIWFGKNPSTDQEICQKFKLFMLAASKGKLDHWKNTPRGRLALIILLDQFSRNIYRNSPQAFQFDQMAQQLTLEGIEQGVDYQLLPIERLFFYLPLEHSEDLSIQKMSVEKSFQLSQEVPDAVKPKYQNFYNYAFRHYEIINLFGRFPHRNQILGRSSSLEEVEFLKQPNSSF